MEGILCGLADRLDALMLHGARPERLLLVGGAARLRLGDPGLSRRRRRRQADAARQRVQIQDAADRILEAGVEEYGLSMLHQEDVLEQLVDVDAVPDADADPLAGPFAHVVVDEAQELSDAEWAMLLRRCPSRSFTIVGDRAQARHGFTETWEERLARIGLDAPSGFSDTTFTASPRLQELSEGLTPASNRILLFALSDADLRRFTLGDPLDLRDHDPAAVVRRGRDRQCLEGQGLALHREVAVAVGRRRADDGDVDRERLVEQTLATSQVAQLDQLLGGARVHPSAVESRVDEGAEADSAEVTRSAAGDIAEQARDHALREVVGLCSSSLTLENTSIKIADSFLNRFFTGVHLRSVGGEKSRVLERVLNGDRVS